MLFQSLKLIFFFTQDPTLTVDQPGLNSNTHMNKLLHTCSFSVHQQYKKKLIDAFNQRHPHFLALSYCYALFFLYQAARQTTNCNGRSHITPIFRSLHLLSIKHRSDFRIAFIRQKATYLLGFAPRCISCVPTSLPGC